MNTERLGIYTILKTINGLGQKCKTYVIESDGIIIFRKLTLITDKNFVNMFGGETVIKETKNYILTYHVFSIKVESLLQSLINLEVLKIENKVQK